MLIVRNYNKMIKTTKNILNSKFGMKDMGLANVIRGVKISRTLDGLVIIQSYYVDKILESFTKKTRTRVCLSRIL